MVGFNDHESSWSCTFDFATVYGCDQFVFGPFVFGPTQARGGTLDLLMANDPHVIRVAVVALIGNSDDSSLSAVISMAQAVPNLCASRKYFPKHQVNRKWWSTLKSAVFCSS